MLMSQQSLILSQVIRQNIWEKNGKHMGEKRENLIKS